MLTFTLIICGCTNRVINSKESHTDTTNSPIISAQINSESAININFNWAPNSLKSCGSYPANLSQVGILGGTSDSLYYAYQEGDEKKLYTCDTKGEKKHSLEQEINDNAFINVLDNYIYYIGKDAGSIFKYNIENSKSEKIYKKKNIYAMAVIGNSIYFTTNNDNNNESGMLCSIDNSGKNYQQIDTGVLLNYLDFDNDNLYYAKVDKAIGINKCSLNSKTKSKIASIDGIPQQVMGNRVFYKERKNKIETGDLCCLNIDTNKTEIIYTANSVKDSVAGSGGNGNIFFYTVPVNSGEYFSLFAYDIKNSVSIKLGDVYNSGICFINNSLYTVGAITGNIEKEEFNNGRIVSHDIIKEINNVS